MNFSKLLGISLGALALAGCVTVSKRLDDAALQEFKGRTPNEFVAARLKLFNGSANEVTNDLQGGLYAAVADIERFCGQEGGKSEVVTRTAPYPKSYVATVPKLITCSCPSSNCPWAVSISYRQTSNEQTRFGPIIRYEVSYVTQTPTDAIAEKANQQRLAEVQRERQEHERKVAQAEMARVEDLNQKFRQSLKIGDRIAMRIQSPGNRDFIGQGLVIELRGPLANVQFSNVEPRIQWVELSRIEDPTARPAVNVR